MDDRGPALIPSCRRSARFDHAAQVEGVDKLSTEASGRELPSTSSGCRPKAALRLVEGVEITTCSGAPLGQPLRETLREI
jgi:hypothetical protein